MKKTLIIISSITIVFVLLVFMFNQNAFKGVDDMDNFTNINNRCDINGFVVNPAFIPEKGCFSITDSNQISGTIAGHELVIKRYDKGVIKYYLNKIELKSEYDASSGNNYVYSSPYIITEGTNSWMFCFDKEHSNCPTKIEFSGDSSDTTSTSSSFIVSSCTGGEQKGSCKAGKIISNHCRGKYCFE